MISKTPEATTEEPLFQGDTGKLDMEARKILMRLLSGPSIDASRHHKLWQALLKHKAIIESRLSELFLQVVIDEDMQVAFCRQADTGDLEAPSLLRRIKMNFLNTALLIYLRKRLTEAGAQGERAVITADEICEHLSLYKRIQNTDQYGFERRIQSVIDNCRKYNILHEISDTEKRYEISPTLKLLFSAEEIKALKIQYENLLKEKTA